MPGAVSKQRVIEFPVLIRRTGKTLSVHVMKLDMHVNMLAFATKTTDMEQLLSTLVLVGEGGHRKKNKISHKFPFLLFLSVNTDGQHWLYLLKLPKDRSFL